jgi:hypothetical protein
MAAATLISALERLNAKVDVLEKAIGQQPARRGQKTLNQLDMFGVPIAAPAPAQDYDMDQLAERLDRAIAQIEDVLQAAA